MQEPDEGAAINSGLMKELASGEKITARDLYAGSKQMVDFDVQAKFHLACNEKPKIQTTDGGTWRRLVVIDFPTKFVVKPTESHEMVMDESLQHKVVSETWATCFLRYMVQLLEDGKGYRKLTPPSQVMAYTNEYQAENDSIARFIQDHMQKVDTTEDDAPYPELITKPELARQFKEWKRINDIAKGTPAELTKRVEAKFGKYPRDGWASFKLERLV
jgi:putative DNA primase/helicase